VRRSTPGIGNDSLIASRVPDLPTSAPISAADDAIRMDSDTIEAALAALD
jgi:hypothetical protein